MKPEAVTLYSPFAFIRLLHSCVTYIIVFDRSKSTHEKVVEVEALGKSPKKFRRGEGDQDARGSRRGGWNFELRDIFHLNIQASEQSGTRNGN